MLKEFQGKVYLAVGRTDLRRGIDGLAAIVQQQFELNPFTETLFLFCGRRKHRRNVHFLQLPGSARSPYAACGRIKPIC